MDIRPATAAAPSPATRAVDTADAELGGSGGGEWSSDERQRAFEDRR